MLDPEYLATLRAFRQALYNDGLGLRQESLVELVDAVLTAAGATGLVRLSLSPPFRRRWPSTCDALSDGSLDVAALRRLLLAHLPTPAAGARPVSVGDGTVWPRPAAATSAERTYGHTSTDGTPQTAIVAAWAYQWLVAVPEPEAGGSWALPLDVSRRAPTAATPTAATPTAGAPTAATPTQTAIAQARRARQAQRAQDPSSPRPVVALDSGHDPSQPTGGRRARRRRGGPPGQEPRLPPRAGAVPRARRARQAWAGGPAPGPDHPGHPDPHRHPGARPLRYGPVTVDAWTALHAEDVPAGVFTVVRVQVAYLPRHARPQPLQPLWLAWIGGPRAARGPLPADLLDVWRWYLARFTVEHLFRFLKQTLGWTTPRLRHPAAADRWTWLLALAVWQLWLARPLVAAQPLPWDRPQPPTRLRPGRVRRAFGGLLATWGSPAAVPQPRGTSPGRRLGGGEQGGEHPRPTRRYPVEKRTHPTAA